MKSADNIVEIEEVELKKYTKLKEGTKIESDDLVHIEENTYAKVGKGNILCKLTVNKYNTILRQK
jgi:translation elongation factor P/translation initiation factor 5A